MTEIICETRFNPEQIEQDLHYGFGNGDRQLISQKILNLSEQGIREALIALGWTPPKEQKNNV